MLLREIFDVTVWCDIEEAHGITAKALDELINQLKDLSAHCEVSDGLGLKRFRIDDETEVLSDDETDYDETSLVIGRVNVYTATFTVEDAKEFIWDAKDTFWAFGIEPHYVIEG